MTDNNYEVDKIFNKMHLRKQNTKIMIEDILNILGYIFLVFGSFIIIIISIYLESFIYLLNISVPIITGVLFIAFGELIRLLRVISINTSNKDN